MTKTKLDLYRSAEAAAEACLNITGQHAIISAALNAFNSEGHHPADFDFWLQTFNTQRATFLQLRGEKATPNPVAPVIAAARKA